MTWGAVLRCHARMSIGPRWRLGMWTSKISPRATSEEDLETPNATAKKIADWFMVTCEKAGADAKDLG